MTAHEYHSHGHRSYTCLRRNRIAFFFFNDAAPTEIYTLSLHDALPISERVHYGPRRQGYLRRRNDGDRSGQFHLGNHGADRKSTRLNSSHVAISYAVFCLKKKNNSSYCPPPNSSSCPISSPKPTAYG